jgi:hypothetical protein
MLNMTQGQAAAAAAIANAARPTSGEGSEGP